MVSAGHGRGLLRDRVCCRAVLGVLAGWTVAHAARLARRGRRGGVHRVQADKGFGTVAGIDAFGGVVAGGAQPGLQWRW